MSDLLSEDPPLEALWQARDDLNNLLGTGSLEDRLHMGDLLLVAAKARRLTSAIRQVRARLGPGDGG